MVFDHSRHLENMAKDVLNHHFKDLNIIWGEENEIFNIFHKYYVINRTRDLKFHRLVWPQHNPELIFPDSVYD